MNSEQRFFFKYRPWLFAAVVYPSIKINRLHQGNFGNSSRTSACMSDRSKGVSFTRNDAGDLIKLRESLHGSENFILNAQTIKGTASYH